MWWLNRIFGECSKPITENFILHERIREGGKREWIVKLETDDFLLTARESGPGKVSLDNGITMNQEDFLNSFRPIDDEDKDKLFNCLLENYNRIRGTRAEWRKQNER